MARLAIAKSFLTGYANLDKKVRKAVDAAIDKFEEHTFAGLHLEKIQGARDPRVRTIKIDDGRRGVVLKPETGDVYCLLAVLEHDAAYKYATGRKFSVNHRLGLLEVRDARALDTLRPALGAVAETTDERLFADFSNADLIGLGLDAEVLPIIRLVTNDDHLGALETMLPEPQFLALLALADGMTLQEAWEEVCRLLPDSEPPAEVDTADLVTAMERTPSEIAFVSGSDELASILENPFALWRLFLHPAQRKLAYRPSYTGSAQVTGGAGTGKTVTALHRARYLAARSERVLVTTFTTTLAEALGRQLDLLIEEPDVRKRVEVINADKLAYRTVKEEADAYPRIIGEAELQALWHRAADQSNAPFSPAFLHREWEQVVLAQGLTSKAAYLACDRRGRGRQLNPAQREQAWAAIARFQETLGRTRQATYLQLADRAAEIFKRRPDLRYRHIVVDEAQDLHPSRWRMLRAAVDSGPDDLFIVGDPHQRIYDNRVSLKRLEIKVAGRSHRLKLSYRTTAEILTWAVRTLGIEPVAGLDDEPATLAGFRSSLHGRRPVVRACPDEKTELDDLVDQVRAWLEAGIEPHAIGIAARFNPVAGRAEQALRDAGIATISLAASGSAPECVRIGSMHRMKGLEFRCVAVIGVNDVACPAPRALTDEAEDPIARRQDLQRERCLLFVACTRARDALYVSYSGNRSSFLPL
ncbi:UvrD-helicase domain-containing protein [Actinomadura rugatobispora]|uniref:DNA 3'-5' helicase n=1 Tax=Actinomadura rugatobispora TaxID=1994 RepID=A0ABW1ADI9_9ACTN|nr:ATP-dependent helicase [Actinomadura rugatobispora]